MKMSKEAREWISAKIAKLVREGKPRDQAVAIAHSMARDKGYAVASKSLAEWTEDAVSKAKDGPKKGEGSRGGTVIGHTPSGRAIYAPKHAATEGMSHPEAGMWHEQKAREHKGHAKEAHKAAGHLTTAIKSVEGFEGPGRDEALKGLRRSQSQLQAKADHHAAMADHHDSHARARRYEQEAKDTMRTPAGYSSDYWAQRNSGRADDHRKAADEARRGADQAYLKAQEHAEVHDNFGTNAQSGPLSKSEGSTMKGMGQVYAEAQGFKAEALKMAAKVTPIAQRGTDGQRELLRQASTAIAVGDWKKAMGLMEKIMGKTEPVSTSRRAAKSLGNWINSHPGERLEKAEGAGPFRGPRDGLWADAAHTIPYNRKKHAGKKVERKGEHDEHGSTELQLHADNSREHYGQKESIRAALANKIANGTYDHAQAANMWRNYVDSASKTYKKQFGGAGGGGGHAFDVHTRDHAARQMADQFHDEVQYGEHDHRLNKKNAKANPKGLRSIAMKHGQPAQATTKEAVKSAHEAAGDRWDTNTHHHEGDVYRTSVGPTTGENLTRELAKRGIQHKRDGNVFEYKIPKSRKTAKSLAAWTDGRLEKADSFATTMITTVAREVITDCLYDPKYAEGAFDQAALVQEAADRTISRAAYSHKAELKQVMGKVGRAVIVRICTEQVPAIVAGHNERAKARVAGQRHPTMQHMYGANGAYGFGYGGLASPDMAAPKTAY